MTVIISLIVIKKWRINGGKEYSLKKLAELINDLRQVIKFTMLYNLNVIDDFIIQVT